MLLAAKKYNILDLDNIHRHLTNTARAIEVENFNEELYIKLLDDLPDYISKYYPHLSDSKESIKQKVLDQIYNITREIFTAYENEYTIFSPMSNCFELFGLDFIIDDQFNVYLLEINPGPDFKQTGDRLKQLITNLWNQTLSLVVDREIYRLDDDYSYRDFTLVYDKPWSSSQFNGGMSLC
uniref:Tubulin--tyrosine ligase-like protein 9 n=1 Tax=Chromulina nebulosa TaxID=96789 RepID=A0A7S0STU0_9STRA|mmetsp:Transcript_2630/g.2316  ORF Transcript_2630/g.2316 Transcript_2630/m.2316 type:complete len:181 (+) Transcript_2630:1-543(+)